MTLKIKTSTKDKHFTLIGPTALKGDPVMCVIIFSRKREIKLYETGMDVFTKKEGSVSDDNYLKNSGKVKRYPGGPTCRFQGVEVPYLARWSKKGSITSEILVNILKTLDHLGVFDRSKRAHPFLLLDGHGSQLEMPFLAYINGAAYSWVVCIGVPYGALM